MNVDERQEKMEAKGEPDRQPCRRAGPTFVFHTKLPDGMSEAEARKRCLEAIGSLVEGRP